MRALSIKQPYAELILRGVKTIEYRSRPTKIVGERFWIYASKSKVAIPSLAVEKQPILMGDNLELPTKPPAPWMIELANALKIFPAELPTGVIVGSAVIEKVSEGEDGFYRWHLGKVERAKRLRKPKGHPQPVWFTPF